MAGHGHTRSRRRRGRATGILAERPPSAAPTAAAPSAPTAWCTPPWASSAPSARASRPGRGRRRGAIGRAAAVGTRRGRHEGPDRGQRRRLPDLRGAGLRRADAGAVLHRPLGAERLRRLPGRVVPDDHERVPARERHPHRLQHAHALVVRPGPRGGARARPVPRRLHRLGAGRLGRGAAPERRVRQHGRGIRRGLRHPRCRPRARAAAHLRLRRGSALHRHPQRRVHVRRLEHLDRRPPGRAGRRRPRDARALGGRQASGLRKARRAFHPRARRHRRRQLPRRLPRVRGYA